MQRSERYPAPSARLFLFQHHLCLSKSSPCSERLYFALLCFFTENLWLIFDPVYPEKLWTEDKRFCCAFPSHALFDEAVRQYTWVEHGTKPLFQRNKSMGWLLTWHKLPQPTVKLMQIDRLILGFFSDSFLPNVGNQGAPHCWLDAFVNIPGKWKPA